MQYTVTATIQGGNIDDNQPVEVKWYSGPSEAQAIVAMGQAATCYTDPDKILPSSVRVRTLSVRLDIEHPEQKGADGAVVGVLDEKAHPSPFPVSHPPAVTDDTTYYMDEFEGLPEKPTLLTFDIGAALNERLDLLGEAFKDLGIDLGMPKPGETPFLLEFDSEGHSLSDCCWWGAAKTEDDVPEWAKPDCSGPRAGIAVFSDGYNEPMCEGHANRRAGLPV